MTDTLIDNALVHRLIAAQFPQWKDLSISPVTPGGSDNKTFRLGDHMLIRIPTAVDYVMAVEKEHQWLPRLAPFLPLPIPVPLAIGAPGEGCPWKWSIYKWLDGETAVAERITNLCDFAKKLARFLIALQRIDVTDGPIAGIHSFYRGGELSVYDAEIRRAINLLKDRLNITAILEIWEAALATRWQAPPVWVHGDVSTNNLLVKEGQLSAVIDFGQLAVGDPACDLMMAWTFFYDKSRQIFREMLPFDSETWMRARAWTLWKALITVADCSKTNDAEVARSWFIINEVLANDMS